jgi:CRP/FNR family transcriptional regulator
MMPALARSNPLRSVPAAHSDREFQYVQPQTPRPEAYASWPLPHASPDGADLLRWNTLSSTVRKVLAGAVLYSKGEPLHFLHAVRTGTLKSCLSLPDGRDQVTGFHMAGEVVGLDGVADGRHRCTVIALEDTYTYAIAYPLVLESPADATSAQADLHRLLSLEITRGHWHMVLLAQLGAHERLASFLLDLSQRSAARGRSAREFNLSMTRRDLGSYLGMALETVSRTFSEFKALRHIEVDRRYIRIPDLPRFASTFPTQLR